MTRIIPSSDPVAMISGVRATIASIEAGCPAIRSTAGSCQFLVLSRFQSHGPTVGPTQLTVPNGQNAQTGSYNRLLTPFYRDD